MIYFTVGTLLASGSDDLNIVVWKWAESKQFFTFDSGHRSNVFQVSCCCLYSMLSCLLIFCIYLYYKICYVAK